MATRALTSALTGLRVHQQWMDVIGDNLANSNTTGFRASRANFGELLSQTLRPASDTSTDLRATDALQIGLGVRLQSVDVRTSQGLLLETGRPLDLSIQGSGFFVLQDGDRDVYTRSGTFGLDASFNLIDLGSGLAVRNADGGVVSLGLQQAIAAQATTAIELGGNLTAAVGGPHAEELSSQRAFLEGVAATITGIHAGPYSFNDGDTMEVSVDGSDPLTVVFDAAEFTDINNVSADEVAAFLQDRLAGLPVTVDGSSGSVVLTTDTRGADSRIQIFDGLGSPADVLGLDSFASGSELTATAATDLSALVGTTAAYRSGDAIRVSGTTADGDGVLADFRIGTDGTTLGELAAFVDAQFDDASASLDAQGRLILNADADGEATLALSLDDVTGNQGAMDFAAHAMQVTTEGRGPDTGTTSIDVFDAAGARHTLTLTMTRTSASEWQLDVTTDEILR